MTFLFAFVGVFCSLSNKSADLPTATENGAKGEGIQFFQPLLLLTAQR
jgi:hypothetical protein